MKVFVIQAFSDVEIHVGSMPGSMYYDDTMLEDGKVKLGPSSAFQIETSRVFQEELDALKMAKFIDYEEVEREEIEPWLDPDWDPLK